MTARQTPPQDYEMKHEVRGGDMPSAYPSLDRALRDHDSETVVVAYSPSILRERARAFVRDFPGDILYAVKANPDIEVLETLVSAGVLGFDVASLDEVELTRQFPGARIHYNNPAKTPWDIWAAYARFGVLDFTADHPSEIDKICAAIPGGDLTVAVRFVPPKAAAAVNLSAKFGAEPEVAKAMLEMLAARGVKAALSFHPGWQLSDTEAHAAGMIAAARIADAAGVDIQYINVGGGFPTHPGSDVTPFIGAVAEARGCLGRLSNIALKCEPGGALASYGCDIAVRVVLKKPGALYLGDGIYGSLNGLLQSPYRVPCDVLALKPRKGGAEKFVAYGPTCDSVDKLPLELELPHDVEEGDWIVFREIGAYSIACASSFNGFKSRPRVLLAA
jgi:ornithine decarboxylase